MFIINRGFEKVEAHLLPVTQEDLCTRRYADSESTLDSDDFSLDSNQSTEVDLVEEIRASIEKSNIMSNICKSVCKSGVGEAHKRETHSLKKLDDISRNRVKSTPTSRRQSVYMQGSKRVKEVVHPHIVQDAKKNMVSVGQRKKISLGADHVKMGNKVATLGSGKDFILSKKSGLGNSCSTSFTTSLESSSSVSVTTSSASSLKSSSNSRRKVDSRKSSLAASGSTSKTLRCSLGDTIVLENPSLSTLSLFMSNHSSYESPASSIDGWSSESSSTANQSSNCLEVSFHTSTSRGACLGNDATQALNFQSFPHDECFDDQESHQTRFPDPCLEVVRGTANDLAKSTRNFKPSGLRMPSPRIGFFDEDKATLSTVGRDFLFHFGAQSALPNISGVTNRKRPDKLQTTRILLENGDTKLDFVQNGVINPSLNAIRRYAA
ncbi:uncharacterized protein LOC114274293 [Camellia sinensis]|uniref:uncharacterized protein LOC114274293 n=1 Tax=Camellia sinensis TaxID=4442 RepID=UPI001035F59A|nr:uncharacterized protein LOC114274293 [Camellia sinensis]